MDDNHRYFYFIEYIFYFVDVLLDLSNGIDGSLFIFIIDFVKKCKLEVHSLSLIKKKQCMTIMGWVRMNFES
jgi:hypothetical protein